MITFKVYHDLPPSDCEEVMNKLSEYGYNVAGVHQYKESGKTLFMIVGTAQESVSVNSPGPNQTAKK